jgi:hypothetical protein
MSPRTEKQEVDEAFGEFIEHREGKIKFHNPRIPLDSPITKEFTDAVDCIEREKKLYEEGTKDSRTLEEINRAITKFLTDTKKARDYLLTVGDLDINIPDHKDLIEQYHKGNIYSSANIDAGNRRDLDRAREWNWIRFRDYLNGLSKKPKTYEDIAYEWNCKCLIYPNGNKSHIKICKYCHVDASNVAHTLSPYNKLLELKK